MKLDWLRLENFGMYGSKRFDFGHQPLVLVYGLNEAGKTTALNGLRQALFGFEVQTPYLTGSTMAAEVHARLRDGTHIEFVRRKKQTGAFSGTIDDRRSLEESELNRLLGQFDLHGYRSLFGFSLDELRSGREALKHARLSDALAGGGLGGLDRLQRLKKELGNSLSETLKKSGTSGRINAKLAEINLVRESLDAAQTHPTQLDGLREQIALAQELREACQEKLELLRADSLRLGQLSEARPKLLELRSVLQQIDDSCVPAAVDAVFCLQWRNLSAQHALRANELADEQRKLDAARRSLAELSEPASWLEHETTIEDLGFQANEIKRIRERLLDLKAEQGEASDEVAKLLRALNLTEITDPLGNLSLSLVQRQELEQLTSVLESATSKLRANEVKLNSARVLQRRLSSDSTAIPVPSNLDELESQILALAQSQAELERLERECEQVSRAANLPSLEAQLAKRVCPESPVSAHWAVPAIGEIQDFQRRMDQFDHDARSAEHEQLILEQELETLREGTNYLRSSSDCPSIEDVERLWLRRDALVKSWLVELQSPLLADSIPVNEQLQRLEVLTRLFNDSDALVRRMLSAADTLAAIRSNEAQIKKLNNQLARVRKQSTARQQQRSALDREWQAAWKSCPFEPLAPAAMLAWSADYRAWCDKLAELSRAEQNVAGARQQVQSGFAQLEKSLPASIVNGRTVSVLQKQVASWKKQRQNDELRAEQRLQAASDLQELEHERRELTALLEDCETRFRIWLRSTQLPESWSLEHIRTLIDCLENCQRATAQLERKSEQIVATSRRVIGYETSVQKLEQKLQSPPSDSSPEAKAESWLKKLKLVREQASRKKNLTYAIQSHSERVAALRTELSECASNLNSLAHRLGDPNREQIDVWIQQASAVANLHERKLQLEIALKTSAGKESLESLVAQLDQLDETSLALQKIARQRELEDLEQRRAAADQQLGALNNELLQRQNSLDALHFAHQLQNLRGELSEMSEQWIVCKLADLLLTRTIQKYAQEHEPVLLKYIGEYLSKLTGQRYTSVEHIADRSGSFIVRDGQGVPRDPDKLSTGTREQLYLAIRLAFISHYSAQHEPLPVIMDDCFVNFDDQRVRFALETLLGWDDSIQTILLSCHSRMVNILSELAPDTPVITLDSDRLAKAGNLALQLAP